MLGVHPGTIFDHPTDHTMIADMLKRLVGLEEPLPSARPSDPYWLPPSQDDWMALTSVAGFAEPDPDRVNRFVAAARKGPIKVQVEVDNGHITEVLGWNLADDPGETADVPDPDPEFQRLLRILEDKIASLPARERRTSGTSGTGTAAGESGPRWQHPGKGGTIRYEDIAGATYLEWSGDATASHVLEYQAGSGFLAFDGEIEVAGTRYDFGEVGQSYWSTWVVPYGRAQFRVRPLEGGAWSDWLELEFAR
jgi:hypothetical protein